MERRFSVVVGDLTASDAQAIVNASDEVLSGRGGVDAAIHAAAGPELASACRALTPLAPGQTVVTPGFRLKAAWIFHTVGPRWQGGSAGEAAVLARCYRSCLAQAERLRLNTLDFCSLSTGVFGYPEVPAATVAEKAIMEFLYGHPFPRRVRMVCRRPETAQVYRQVSNQWYAVSKEDRL